jgi:sugar/nucleoside kinase (ribokinase family)
MTSSLRPSIVVVGGASLDILHFAGRTERAPGGAGLYTSLAAERAGAAVTMIGPRPEPAPAELALAMERLDWRGPEVTAEELPTFEIAHLGGGHSELRNIWWRAEGQLAVDNLPSELPAGFVYCIALAEPERQLAFLRHFSSQGRRLGTGTFKCAIREAPELMVEALELADVFFCNEHEASLLFGGLEKTRARPGKLLFVTRSSRGVRVFQGEHATDVPAIEVEELDPTGAGDTFCGTTLSLLERGFHPVLAAERGAAAAAHMVTGVGPERLFEPPESPARESLRVSLDRNRIRRVAAVLADSSQVEPSDFTGPRLPPVGAAGCLDFFFASTLQQFAFWTARDGHYERPIVVEREGHALKGSDFLFASYLRWLETAPEGLRPEAQAELTRAELERRLAGDDGVCPLPDLDRRLELARAYGRDLIALETTPEGLVAGANRTDRPLASLLGSLDHVGGYKEDPLRKKSALLAIILRQRPERFLRTAADDEAPPIIDYHVQRSCLRMGLVLVEDQELRRKLVERRLLEPGEESAVRRACHRAVEELGRLSGRSTGAVDWFLFQNRRRCPEMTEPECDHCPVDGVCAHLVELFQPVLPTTFY